MKTDKIINSGIYLLILLIPFQIYFNFYKNLSVSVAQILAGILFVLTIWRRLLEKEKNDFGRSSIDLSIVVFVVVMFLSILVSDNKSHSIKYFTKWTSFILIFFVAYLNIRDTQSLNKCLKIALFTVLLVSIAAIFEYIEGYERVIGWFSNSPFAVVIMEPETLREKLSTGQLNWIIWADNGIRMRAFGTFEDVISFSAYLGLVVPFFIWLFKHSYHKWSFYFPLFLIIISALFLTFTRSAYLSFVIMAGILIFPILRYVSSRKVLIISSSFVILIAALIILYKPAKEILNVRFNKPFAEQFDRKELWLQGLRIFKSKPILGVGVANYQSGLIHYAGKDAKMLPAHNQYIQIAAEMGIIGLAVYLSILFFGIKYSYLIFTKSSDIELKYLGLGFLGMWIWYCIQSVFSGHLFGDKYSMMFWLMVGLNAALFRIHKMVKG